MKRQKCVSMYQVYLFSEFFCAWNFISRLMSSFCVRVNYQKHRAEVIKIFITYTLRNCYITTEKCHKIAA